MQPFGAAADNAPPQQAARRRRDQAGNRNAVGHDGDIDRELVAAGEKFPGAVERVDDHEARIDARRQFACGTFFRNHLNAGQQAGEAFDDQRFGRLVGRGDGRQVVLDSAGDRVKRCRERGGRGAGHDVRQGVQMLFRKLRGDFLSACHALQCPSCPSVRPVLGG